MSKLGSRYLLSPRRWAAGFTLALAILATTANALGPAPACKDALWWGQTWGTANISQKIVQHGDIITITANLTSPDFLTPAWYCGWGSWNAQGTYLVEVNIPGCFELVDYSPKADVWHGVGVGAGSVRWGAVADDLPPPDVARGCYCHWDNSRDYSGCPSVASWHPRGMFKNGDTFTLTLRATCSAPDANWRQITAAWFSGNSGGIYWSNNAEDYFKFGGQIAVSLAAYPQVLPADGTASVLWARVFEQSSGVDLPRQMVGFSSQFGVISPPSSQTDPNGNATSSLSSPGVEGDDLVQASVPGDQDQIAVTFTHPDNPPVGPETHLGTSTALSLISEPVHAGIGNYVFSKTLFAFPGKSLPLTLEVTYNSLDAAYNGPLGYGWTHTYNAVLTASGDDITIKWGDGHVNYFHGDGSGNFTPVNCTTPVQLSMPDASHYEATLYNKVKYRFDSSGKLLSIVDLNGNQLAFTHSSQLDQITDTAGRQTNFTYTNGRITSITSPLKAGNTVEFQYDPNGDLTGIVDPRGKTWGFTYDGAHRAVTNIDAKGTTVVTNTYDPVSGRIIQQQDGAGNMTTYEATVDPTGTRVKVTPPSGSGIWHYYDRAYNLTAVIDGEGHQARFASDSQGRLAGAIDKNSGATQVGYDANGNLIQAKDRTGALSWFGFSALNRPTSVTDPLGNTDSFGWDANGNFTGLTNANGEHMSVTVDASGLPTVVSDFRGRQWGFAYDASGLLQTATDPTGMQAAFTHDAAGRVTQVQMPVTGATLQVTYDDAGNLLTRTDPLGNLTSFTYNDNGNLATRTFAPAGATTTYDYDWAGRPTTITDAVGGVITFTYDADGNLATVTDPDGVTITRQYNKANRLISAVDPLGHRTHYGYDAAGNLTSVTDELGNTWSTTYDAEGQPVQTTDPLGATSTVAYDDTGRVTRITDELAQTATFQYDRAGRLLQTVLPDQGVVNYISDPNGRPWSVTDSLGHSWRFSYDDAGRLSGEVDPNGRTETYGYDTIGRLTTKTLRDGTVITYAYDANNRLTSVTLPGPTIITYAYEAAGNLSSVTDPSGTITMTYDKLGRRLTRTDPGGRVMAFTYTPAGRLETVTYPGTHVVAYAYDTVGRLATITDWKGNQTTFEYDGADRVAQVNLPNGTRTSFTYDAAGRVATRVGKKADSTVLASYTYGYDATGQIAWVQRTEPATPAFPDSNATYTYDPVNQMLTADRDSVSTTYGFDLRGNLTSRISGGVTTICAYDALNRLISVSDGLNTTTYTYDGGGDRLSKTFNGDTTRYLRDGGTIYCALDGSGNVESYNIYAGSLLYSLDASGALKAYHSDERGSVVAITDASQNVVQSYSYDPYGKVLGASGSLDNTFQYVGGYGVTADEDGLLHMGARYYDPDVKRFITQDPLGLAAGLNLYAYVGGDPINSIDPAGLKKPNWWKINTYGTDDTAEIDKILQSRGQGGTAPAPAVNQPPALVTNPPAPSLVPSTEPANVPQFVLDKRQQLGWKAPPSNAQVIPEEVVKERAKWSSIRRPSVRPLTPGEVPKTIPNVMEKGFELYPKGSHAPIKPRGPRARPKFATSGGGVSVVEALGEFTLGLVLLNEYFAAGPVWDSSDNTWKSWDQYWEEHFDKYTPNFDKYIPQIDIRIPLKQPNWRDPMQVPFDPAGDMSKLFNDWVNGGSSAHLDELKKKAGAGRGGVR